MYQPHLPLEFGLGVAWEGDPFRIEKGRSVDTTGEIVVAKFLALRITQLRQMLVPLDSTLTGGQALVQPRVREQTEPPEFVGEHRPHLVAGEGTTEGGESAGASHHVSGPAPK